MSQVFLAIAAIFGGLSVAAGAFASHALREKLSERAGEILKLLPVIRCIMLWRFY